MDEAERCTKLAYISNGHLLAEGSIAEIIKQSHLHTWVVSNGDLSSLATKLKSLPGVEQIAFFGQELHISGKNNDLLEKTIADVKTSNQVWEKITPSLEDVFINLVGKKREGKE